MTFIFFGSGTFALPALRMLVKSRLGEIAMVITQPDRPFGRTRTLTATPVKQCAQQLSLPVHEKNPKDAIYDIGIAVDFGKIISRSTIACFRFGILNIHPSLLPAYRGPAPIQHALLAGDRFTGVSIICIDAGIDTGPLLAQRRIEITPTDTAQTLELKLAEMGAQLLLKVLPAYVDGKCRRTPQHTTGVSVAPKLTRAHGKLRPSMTIHDVWNHYRALHPWPGVFFTSDGKRIKITKMIWGKNAPIITELQPEGKRKMSVAEFKQGYPTISFSNLL